MTRDEILNMPPGQDMDLLIAQEVLHLSVEEWNSRFFRYHTHYSTDIAAAWEVAEKFVNFSVGRAWKLDGNSAGYSCWTTENDGSVFAETAQLAICRAALLAVLDK